MRGSEAFALHCVLYRLFLLVLSVARRSPNVRREIQPANGRSRQPEARNEYMRTGNTKAMKTRPIEILEYRREDLH